MVVKGSGEALILLRHQVGLTVPRESPYANARGMRMADLSQLQETLGFRFEDESLLKLALTHSSYVNENPHLSPASNERLEFLGDAVLGLIVAEKLYDEFPDCPEGEMTQLRAGLVRRMALAGMARGIGLGNYLYLGRGEEAGGGRTKPVNLAGALEALIAAVFLDQGLEQARRFALRLIGPELVRATGQEPFADYKSRLQELVQARRQKTPVYHVVGSTGPDHSREFTVEVRVGDRVLGSGTGHSKKAAQMDAARDALEKLPSNFTG